MLILAFQRCHLELTFNNNNNNNNTELYAGKTIMQIYFIYF